MITRIGISRNANVNAIISVHQAWPSKKKSANVSFHHAMKRWTAARLGLNGIGTNTAANASVCSPLKDKYVRMVVCLTTQLVAAIENC